MENLEVLESHISRLLSKFSELKSEKKKLTKRISDLELELALVLENTALQEKKINLNRLEEENKQLAKERDLIKTKVENILCNLTKISI